MPRSPGIGTDGKVAYKGKPRLLGFDLDEVENWLAGHANEAPHSAAE